MAILVLLKVKAKITNCHFFMFVGNKQQLVLFWVMAYVNLIVSIQKLLKKGHLVGEAYKIHSREIGKSENVVSKGSITGGNSLVKFMAIPA